MLIGIIQKKGLAQMSFVSSVKKTYKNFFAEINVRSNYAMVDSKLWGKQEKNQEDKKNEL